MGHLKHLPIFILALGIVAGCKPAAQESANSSPTPDPSIPPVASNNTPTSPSTTPSSTNQPSATNQPRVATSAGVPGTTNSASFNQTRVNPSSPPVPRENPQAAPPKPGEQVVRDFKIQTPTQTVEVEGVCKLTEDEAICWKPSGQSNDDLAKELTNAIQSKTDSYGNSFQFRFKKKNRVLVLKTTTQPPKPGVAYDGGMNGSLMNQYFGGSEFSEGWTQGNSMFNGASSTGFDQARIERQVLTGAFNKETGSFPLRYQVTKYERNPQTSIPVKKGVFEAGGNTYEIVSISDKPSQPGYSEPSSGMNAPKQKFTYLTIKPVKINDPYSMVTLTPADDSGVPYGGLDENGNPISAADAAKKREEEQKKMMEASRSGQPYSGRSMMMNNYIRSAGLDPLSVGRQGESVPHMLSINVEPSKLKKFSVTVQHRTVYVFDKIKLDKN